MLRGNRDIIQSRTEHINKSFTIIFLERQKYLTCKIRAGYCFKKEPKSKKDVRNLKIEL